MAPPPRKRSRSITPVDAASPTQGSDYDLQRINNAHAKAVQRFVDELDTIESTNARDSASIITSAATLLVGVKSLQRKIYNSLDAALAARDEKRIDLERQKLLLENLEFEKKHLEVQLRKCKEFPTPNLEKMSREELDDEETDLSHVMNHFLCGSTESQMQDPAHQNKVVAFLHKELNLRGALQRDLLNAQNDLTKRKRIVQQEQGFLNEIPQKLVMIERSSVPLQKFFQSSSVSTSPSRFIGTDRKKRLDMARSLPAPLYAIFVQFQYELDAQGNENVSLEIARYNKGKKSFEIPPHDQVVHLGFVIPDVPFRNATGATTVSKRKRVTVEFAYIHAYNLITAQAFGSEKINSPPLLEKLFPSDCGEWIGKPDDSTSLPGKPYHWCNFLAGLHYPWPEAGAESLTIHLSTKAVVKELLKRVQSNAILTQILSSFDMKQPVLHPTSDSSTSNSVSRLSNWTLAEEYSKKFVTNYFCTVKHNAQALSARVCVDWCGYPAVRPRWTLFAGPEAGSQTPGEEDTNLFSPTINQIESQVNSCIVDEAQSDFIIASQLSLLMELWDSACGEESSPARRKKGRNRV
jgi:hypothetical protein